MDDIPHGAQASEETSASAWDRDAAKRALDDLFSIAGRYRATKAYKELVDFVARFRFYSPFNALLIHVQKPGATFVAPAHRWRDKYKREIMPGAQPIVILRPMGPVMFVFDVSQTEPTEDAPELPSEVTDPFPTSGADIGLGLPRVIENGKRDGVRVKRAGHGSQWAGSIRIRVFSGVGISQEFQDGLDRYRRPTYVEVPVRYDLLVNSKHSPEARYATVAHELAHLYCGHLGSPDPKWWPDRQGLEEAARELEAESISYMVCSRLGIKTSSAEYLESYVNAEVPSISLELVMKTAGLIESMTKRSLKPRRDESSQGRR